MKNNDFLSALSDFFTSYLPDTKGLSSNTITAYQYAFQLLFEFLMDEKGITPDKVTFRTLSEENLRAYLRWLETKRNCSAATRNFRRSALCSFAKFAIRKGQGEALAFYSAMSTIPTKKTPKDTVIRYFTKDEVAILLNTPNSATSIGKRDTVLMSVLYASGARAQEICNLTINDISFGKSTNIRLVGKGNKARLVTLPNNCATLLRKYIESRGFDPASPQDRSSHVFSSQTHEKMSVSCVEAIVKKYITQAKSKNPTLFLQGKYSPHSFRHSIAVHMLECGESLVVIKAFLGHESINTTTIYTSVTPELANKYLRERGKVFEKMDTESLLQTNRIAPALPFLSRLYKKQS